MRGERSGIDWLCTGRESDKEGDRKHNEPLLCSSMSGKEKLTHCVKSFPFDQLSWAAVMGMER